MYAINLVYNCANAKPCMQVWYQTIFKTEFAFYRSTIKSNGMSLILMNNF